ncbi:MAG: hypothetical protein WCP21_02160 [Armatimonadota bacterium]
MTNREQGSTPLDYLAKVTWTREDASKEEVRQFRDKTTAMTFRVRTLQERPDGSGIVTTCGVPGVWLSGPALSSCLAVASCLGLLIGCGGSGTVPPAITLTAGDFGHTLHMTLGQTAVLTVQCGVGHGVDCTMTPGGVLWFTPGPQAPDGTVLLAWQAVETGRTEVVVRRYVLGPPSGEPDETVGSFAVVISG